MLIYKLKVLLLILLLYLIAGSIDFYFKERTWYKLRLSGGAWSDMPQYLMHSKGWWIWITIIWALPLLLLAVYIDTIFYTGFIIFFLEDIIYFSWKKIIYKEGIQKTLNYFLPSFLRKKDFRKKDFIKVFLLQVIIFLIVFILV